MIKLIAGWGFMGMAHILCVLAAYDTWFSKGPKAGLGTVLFFIPIFIFMIGGAALLHQLVNGLMVRFWYLFILPAMIIAKALLLLFGK